MYLYIFGGFILVTIIGLIYLWTRFLKFRTVQKLSGGRKWAARLIAAVPVLIMAACIRLDPVNVIIAIVHLLVFFIACSLIGRLIRRRGPVTFYWEGLCAIIITSVYLGCGWYLAHHVVETDYHLVTDKTLGKENLRIVQISDSHIGATFDGDGFARHMETVQKAQPDVLVITGDYVDDDTKKEDMVKSCAALGKMETTYGIYYVFGNHDKGYGNYRDFTTADLVAELEKNNVVVLEDESVLLNDSFYIVGRQDRSHRGRASVEELTKDLDPAKYIVVLDHQPQEFADEEKAGVDLVLCGHTHGGQMIPVGFLGEFTKANEKTYGLETRGTTNIIVNSGISDWAIRFKTGTIAEYGVIDVTAGR